VTTRTNPKPSLRLEPLEDRALAAAGLSGISKTLPSVTATLSLGVLRVNGTFMADAINVRQANGVITVGGVAGYFPAAAVNRIEVNGFGGNDVIRLNSETMPGGQPIMKPCAVHGGVGNDAVFGGYGNDTLSGDAGNDLILGGPGVDLLVGGAGADTLYGGAGNDRLIGETADAVLAGQAGTDVVAFQQVDPAPLADHDPAAMRAALQVGLAGWSFSRSQGGGKVTVSSLEVQDVTIENGVTTVHLKGKIQYKKTTGFPQFSVSGSIKFSVRPQLNANFVEGQLQSASVKLAGVQVKEVNLSNVPNWLDNSSEVRNFLEGKLAQQPPLPVTGVLQMYLATGGSLGPTIAA
jgi:hypothetical protein